MVAVALVVAAYGASMVLVPQVTGGLFAALGFGMREAGIVEEPARSYVFFLYGVLGSVLIGWMALVAAVAAGPLRDGSRWAGRALAFSLGSWFVVDTGLSLVLGEGQHALFNVGFLAALGLPMLMWHRDVRRVPGQATRESRSR